MKELETSEKELFDTINVLETERNSIEKFKRLNFIISITPTIVATLLTIYVFYNNFKFQDKMNNINETSKLKDSIINLTGQIINFQDSLIPQNDSILADYKFRRSQRLKKDIDSVRFNIMARESIQK